MTMRVWKHDLFERLVNPVEQLQEAANCPQAYDGAWMDERTAHACRTQSGAQGWPTLP